MVVEGRVQGGGVRLISRPCAMAMSVHGFRRRSGASRSPCRSDDCLLSSNPSPTETWARFHDQVWHMRRCQSQAECGDAGDAAADDEDISRAGHGTSRLGLGVAGMGCFYAYSAPLTGSGCSPLPATSMRPTSYCATALPPSAAFTIHFSASILSCGTPSPSSVHEAQEILRAEMTALCRFVIPGCGLLQVLLHAVAGVEQVGEIELPIGKAKFWRQG